MPISANTHLVALDCSKTIHFLIEYEHQGDDYEKKINLMWDGINFFIYKTKMELIFNFVKKSFPPNDSFAPHFYFLAIFRRL